MVKVKDPFGNEFGLDSYLVGVLDTIKKALRKDMDAVILVDGREGSGKSMIAQQIASYIDPTFNINRMCVTSEEFINAAVKCEKYQAIVYDEALEALGSMDHLTKNQKHMKKFLAESRQLNLCSVICMPSFFDLTKNIAIHRSVALIHVYTENVFERGRFVFFNVERKTQLFMQGKKFYNHNAVKGNFFSRFVNHWCIDEQAYRKKKYDTLKRYQSEQEKEEKKVNETGERVTKRLIIGTWAINEVKLRTRLKWQEIARRIEKESGMPISDGHLREFAAEYRDRYRIAGDSAPVYYITDDKKNEKSLAED